MAEALVNHDLGDRFEAFSAGTEPKEPHPLALEALAELGIDHKEARGKHMDEFSGESFDHVITLCDNANQACPFFIGGVKREHMGFEDPDQIKGDEKEKLAVFREVRDQIREKIEAYLIKENKNSRL